MKLKDIDTSTYFAIEQRIGNLESKQLQLIFSNLKNIFKFPMSHHFVRIKLKFRIHSYFQGSAKLLALPLQKGKFPLNTKSAIESRSL